MKVGDHVVFCDEMSIDHDALVTAIWSTSMNLVIVSKNEKEEDQYGRQIKRPSSIVHMKDQGALGNYWRFSEEEKKR